MTVIGSVPCRLSGASTVVDDVLALRVSAPSAVVLVAKVVVDVTTTLTAGDVVLLVDDVRFCAPHVSERAFFVNGAPVTRALGTCVRCVTVRDIRVHLRLKRYV